MDATEHLVEVEGVELDPKLCSYVYPEGHEKAGQQCIGGRTGNGYCPPHARSLGLLPGLAAAKAAREGTAESKTEAVNRLNEAQEIAEISLSANAAAWLAAPKTQRQLRKRWDEIAEKGADSELIRLVKELSDRVYGRATEQREEPAVELPNSLAEVRAMSASDRRALLLGLERKGTG